MRFFVVEDDPDLGDAIVRRLRREGHAVDLEKEGDAASEILEYQAYDAVILDIGLPNMDGFAVLKNLRNRGDKTPVMMLTARSGIEDKVDALDVGADDYLPKPFDFREFDARCRALLRRSTGIASGVSVIGRVEFDRAAKVIRIDGETTTLPNREYRLLELLIGNLDRVLSKQQIADQLFDFDSDASANAIELYIGRLRKKLGTALTIRTQRGFGYVIESHEAAVG